MRKYISKKDHKVAEDLAYKNLLTLQLNSLLQEKKAIESYLKHYTPDIHQNEIDYVNSPAYQKLVAPHHKLFQEEQEAWINESYVKNTFYPESLTVKGTSGISLRSKSEAIIENVLCKYHIPFRYEARLDLGDLFYYPDFTILHPTTHQLVYWENFGMMDNPTYAKGTAEKLEQYIAHGILPSHQLICTYETKEHPLGFDLVEKMVDHYLL